MNTREAWKPAETAPAWAATRRPRTKAELKQAIEQGDPSAFQEMLVRHVERICGQWRRRFAREKSQGCLPEQVLQALCVGLSHKIASPAFESWCNITAAEATLAFLNGRPIDD